MTKRNDIRLQSYYTKLESSDNKLVKHLSKLVLSKHYRDKHNQSVLLGEHLILEAIKHNVLQSIFVVDDKINIYLNLLENIAQEIPVYVVSKSIMGKIIGKLLESNCNLIGTLNLTNLKNSYQNPINLSDSWYHNNCIVLEDIQDPGNIGTIMRGAYAAGINHVVLSNNCADIFSPKVLRSSQGVSLGLEVYVCANLVEFLNEFAGDKIITLPSSTTSIYDFVPANPNSIAWIFGNEGSGVSYSLQQITNLHLSIPMHNQVDSLNVAMAATVCMFEHLRWRLKTT